MHAFKTPRFREKTPYTYSILIHTYSQQAALSQETPQSHLATLLPTSHPLPRSHILPIRHVLPRRNHKILFQLSTYSIECTVSQGHTLPKKQLLPFHQNKLACPMEYMGARERCPYECGHGSTHAHNRYSAPQLDDPLHEKGGPRIKQKPSELMYIWG